MENTATLGFRCNCGAVQGHLAPERVKSGTHIECFCNDCRAAQLYFGQDDPRPHGVHIFQTTPDAITLTSGSEHLGILQLGPKGPFRWYATCCNSPLGNTLNRPGVPFFGLAVDRLDDPDKIGRVRARAFVPGAPGQSPKHKGTVTLVTRFVSQALGARVSGRWRRTPFFDIATGKPVVTPKALDRAERAALMTR